MSCHHLCNRPALDVMFCFPLYPVGPVQTRLCEGFMNWHPNHAAVRNSSVTLALTLPVDTVTISLVNLHGILDAYVGVETIQDSFLLRNIFHAPATDLEAIHTNERVT